MFINFVLPILSYSSRDVCGQVLLHFGVRSNILSNLHLDLFDGLLKKLCAMSILK